MYGWLRSAQHSTCTAIGRPRAPNRIDIKRFGVRIPGEIGVSHWRNGNALDYGSYFTFSFPPFPPFPHHNSWLCLYFCTSSQETTDTSMYVPFMDILVQVSTLLLLSQRLFRMEKLLSDSRICWNFKYIYWLLRFIKSWLCFQAFQYSQ